MAAGVIGSLVAAAVLCVFTDPFVRGVGITVALVFAMGRALEVSIPMRPETRK